MLRLLKHVKWLTLIAVVLLAEASRPYPIDMSASGLEQRITYLEARVDSLEAVIDSIYPKGQ